MIAVAHLVGRLIGVRFVSPIFATDLIPFEGMAARLFREATAPLVCCTDFTESAIMPPEVLDRIVMVLRRDNPKLARNGVLLPPHRAGLRMQIERLIRAGEHPGRRAFPDAASLLRWLDEVLSLEERVGLRRFLPPG